MPCGVVVARLKRAMASHAAAQTMGSIPPEITKMVFGDWPTKLPR